MSLFTKLFGTYSERQLKKIEPIAQQIEALADKYAAMSDEMLREQTEVLKRRLKAGETLDDILPDAFAVVREASTRVSGKRHFYVQLLGGIVLHQGRIAEMKTGEGKTLTATLPAYLNALTGKGVHIVTVNDYLAKRDSEWMGNIYRFLGLSVGLIINGLDPDQRRAAYAADITYGTNNEFGFDYLRDNMVIYKEHLVQRGHEFAIVDEVDSILIDEARTPLIISGPGEESSELYKKADDFVRRLKCYRIKEFDSKRTDEDIEEDYIVDEKARTAVLTANGVKKAEEFFHVQNLGDSENIELMHYINNALRARGIMQRDVDYVVKDGKVIIVDAFTGRIMPGRRYSNGLHQAIEAKEGVRIEQENKTQATITFQNYFRMYKKLSGMTGTAQTEEMEFREIYNLDVVEIPTNKPMIRIDHNDVVYRSIKGKYKAIIEQIKECHEKGQPVLVGTVSIEKSELLSKMLEKEGIKHNVLNAKNHEREAEIIAQAGKLGAVTISTNMAGRGTDIMLGGNSEFLAKTQMKKEGFDDYLIYEAMNFGTTDDEQIAAARARFRELKAMYDEEVEKEAKLVREAGGLFIIGTERHESRRIDNQLRGRAGRQGDPGESRFFISLEDDLMRLFGSDKVLGLVDSLNMPEDQPIDSKYLSNSIERAQKRIEGQNFERRKHVLEYDDVMNRQRELIYKQRREVLDGTDLKDKIWKMVAEYIESVVYAYTQGDVPDEWNFEGIRSELGGILCGKDDFHYSQEEIGTVTRESIIEMLTERAEKRYAAQEELFTPEVFREVERAILLRSVDRKWVDHIDAMYDLEESIGLNAYAQRNPIQEYKIQGGAMFDEMVSAIREETVRLILTVVPRKKIQREQVLSGKATMKSEGGTVKPTPTRKTAKVGPNDPCPCGSGKKYKKCCGSPAAGDPSNK
ncbi:MAG TPA: preprotein translocase subunit SecA [Bacillota bacterium]|nr:preprotein translocase subunit SecA [Bacillota bacterium]HOK68437.1 preprotein translocase subunit SecA [Bacillota bacterium]HPP85071.1 preprotein translocase subunit SecA [Bacillota bacterium]